MRALKSPVIPEDAREEAEAELVSAKTWGDMRVQKFIKENVKVKAKDQGIGGSCNVGFTGSDVISNVGLSGSTYTLDLNMPPNLFSTR
jgi:hypothetical protein